MHGTDLVQIHAPCTRTCSFSYSFATGKTRNHVRLINLLFSAYLFASNEEIAVNTASVWTWTGLVQIGNERKMPNSERNWKNFTKWKTTSQISKSLRPCLGGGGGSSGGIVLPLRITYSSLYPYHVSSSPLFSALPFVDVVVAQFTVHCSRFVLSDLSAALVIFVWIILHWCIRSLCTACLFRACKNTKIAYAWTSYRPTDE